MVPRVFNQANSATLLTSLAIQGCGVVTGILTARILGPEARGELAAVMLWPVILSNLGLLGCNWAVAREVAVDPEGEPNLVRSSMMVGFWLALSAALAGYMLAPYLLPSDKSHLLALTRVCLILIPLDLFSQMLLAAEHGRMRWRRYNLLRASFFVCYMVMVIALWAGRISEVSWFVWAFLASHSLAVFTRVVVQWHLLAAGALHLRQCRRLLKLGLPYFWSTASNLLTLQIDKILVVALMSTEAVGIYAAAITFSNAHSSLGEALGITSFAELANETNREQQGRVLSETFRQATITALGLGAALACLIPFLVQPMFGPEFAPAAAPAVVLTLGSSVAAASNVLNQGLKGAGRPYAGLLSQLVGTGVLAVTAMHLSPKLGLMGLAWAVVISAVCQLLLLTAAAARMLRISPVALVAG